AFINEIASLGEHFGADGKEVERGLKSDIRIGPRAYLSAGGPFAGGTLARDLSTLATLANRVAMPALLLRAVYSSNHVHKDWPRRKLQQLLGNLSEARVTILGLTYKPGTNTLRRSAAVELCRWLAARGAQVEAYDPAVDEVSGDLADQVRIHSSFRAALTG